MNRDDMKQDLRELFDRYSQEFLDFDGLELTDVNQAGAGGAERPLHAAARNGLIDDMRILLREGAGIHASGDSGLSPLHYAAMNGHTHAVALLLAHGARKEAKDMDGALPIDWARNLERTAVVALLDRPIGAV